MTASVAARDHREDSASPGPSPSGSLRIRTDRLLGRTYWALPALLTLLLGVRGSSRPELWRDELATWSAATRSTGEIFDMLKHVDAVSGAYYLLMHFWIGVFGDSPAVFRLPTALALAGAAAFTTLAARRLFDTRTALFAGVLFATIPSISRFAQEARAYGFVLLAVSAATWLLLRALERPTLVRWLPYAVAVAAAGLFHMVSLLFLSGHAVVVLLRWRRSRDRRLLLRFPVAVAVGLVPVIPLVLLGRRQVGRQISWLHEPWLQTFHDYWHNLFGSPLISYCFLLLVAIPAGWSRRRMPAFEIGVVAALPIGLSWLASHGSSVYFFERYQLYTLPAWSILAAAGLASIRPRLVGLLGLATVVAIGIPDQQKLRSGASHEYTDGRGAARIIADGYKSGDAFAPLLGSQSYMMLDLEIGYYLPDDVHLKDPLVARTAVQRGDLFSTPCKDPVVCLAGTDRIWVVTMGHSSDLLESFPAVEAAALRSSFTETEVKQVRGLTVALLERRAG